ncbi:MAG TPA: helix-turn-helix domain-containing protein [Pyrinomonadaceae bacterium]|jgi:excisionase family DNA binding protein
MDSLLEQLDERMRRIAEDVVRGAADRHEPKSSAAANLLDDEARREIQEQTLISNKNYLTRREAAKYLGVNERSIKEWSDRPVDQNPLPEVRAGADPRYRRTALDEWLEREGQRQRLRLAG